MRLDTEFYKLPLKVDVKQLIKEVDSFTEDEWRVHPQQFEGNTSMILVAVNGEINDDMHGPMLPTEKLKRCPYIKQVLASFNTVIGRSRLMRLSPQATVPTHTDINYYWRDRFRIHIPIVTDPSIRFCCNGNEVNMAAGEVWVFDNWKNHTVINPSDVTRIHLVADTTGSSLFWKLMEQAERPFDKTKSVQSEPQLIVFEPDTSPELKTELHNASIVMHPGELELLVKELRDDLLASPSVSEVVKIEFTNILSELMQDWRSTWSIHGENDSGWTEYQRLIDDSLNKANLIDEPLPVVSNSMLAASILASRLGSALNPKLKRSRPSVNLPLENSNNRERPKLFDRPIFIVAGPRSGSTLLFETLARSRKIWTIGGESHQIIEGIDALNPALNNFHSNQLTAEDSNEEIRMSIRQKYFAQLQDSEGRLLAIYTGDERPASLRFLEKTPKNALRIPFIKTIFPDALFIFLYRKPRDNISSIIDAWRSGQFVTYQNLPDWQGTPWSLLLPPGWRELNSAPVEKIAAFQWQTTNQKILDDLTGLPASDWCSLSYEEFLKDTMGSVKKLCEFVQIPFGQRMKSLADGQLPNSRYTLTPPDPEKWRKNEKEVMSVIKDVEQLADKLSALSV